MKTRYWFPKTLHLLRIVMLGWVLVHPAWRLAAQTIYAEPYTFSTLRVNGRPEGGKISSPKAVAVDAAGNIYVASMFQQVIYRITPAGDIAILAGKAGVAGSADGSGSEARFCYPQGVAVDRAGNVYVADSCNNCIRRISCAGGVTTLAGLAGYAGCTDGIGSAARFYFPVGVAADDAGNVFVADMRNGLIRKVTFDGVVTTLAGQGGVAGGADGWRSAAQFNFPVGVAVDAAGTVYVADYYNNAIRKVTSAGVVTTLAGNLTYDTGCRDGVGSAAQFYHPWGLAVDHAGNVYVADCGNDTIRRVTPEGSVATLAGIAGGAGDTDGVGGLAQFRQPAGLAVDRFGTVYVADLGNGTIREGMAGSGITASVSRGTGAGLPFTKP